jgi:hypothetical protein
VGKFKVFPALHVGGAWLKGRQHGSIAGMILSTGALFVLYSAPLFALYFFDDDRWQFKHRKIVMDWHQVGRSSCDFSSPAVADSPVGDRIEKDPAQTFFSILKT